MQEPAPNSIASALAEIPSGLFVLTARHDESRTGVLVNWVQQCSHDPPMVIVVLRKGHPVEPLIRDSRVFALCQLDASDLLLRRKFDGIPDHGEDLFMSVPTTTGPLGSPVLERARAWVECELSRHVDLECDYEVYVGLVRAGGRMACSQATAPTTPAPKASPALPASPAATPPAKRADQDGRVAAKRRTTSAESVEKASRDASQRLRSRRRHSA